MNLIKKNLKTVSNKLLCELEDYLLDGIMSQVSSGKTLTNKQQEQLAQEMMSKVMNAIKDNAVRFAIICYTDEDGKALTKETLIDIPLKLKIYKECLEDIMNIMSDYLSDDEEIKPSGKHRIVRRK